MQKMYIINKEKYQSLGPKERSFYEQRGENVYQMSIDFSQTPYVVLDKHSTVEELKMVKADLKIARQELGKLRDAVISQKSIYTKDMPLTQRVRLTIHCVLAKIANYFI